MSNIPNPIVANGLTLFHEPGRPSLTVRALALDQYEPSVSEAMRSRLGAGMVVLDLGAHIGYHTLMAARMVGTNGHVFAFEPDPDLRQTLKRNVNVNRMQDRVSVVAAAIGSSNGGTWLHRDPVDSGSSFIVTTAVAADDFRVELTTLDSWASEYSWPEISLIKMDVEGSEPEVLAGMKELVRRNPSLVLIVECQKGALERTGQPATRLFDALFSLGFESIEVLGEYLGPGLRNESPDLAAILDHSRWFPINLCCSRDA